MFTLIVLETLILIAEIVAFPLTVKERKRGKIVACVLTANLASLVVGGFLISFLPV
jgi:hypothetical protein